MAKGADSVALIAPLLACYHLRCLPAATMLGTAEKSAGQSLPSRPRRGHLTLEKDAFVTFMLDDAVSQETKSKIVNPERIYRLMQKVCTAGMQAIIREKQASTVGIRAAFKQIYTTAQGKKLLILGHISEEGLARLPVGTVISVEISGLSSKVNFLTKVMAPQKHGLAVLIPMELYSIERRQAARFACRPELAAFVAMSEWGADDSDLGSPPATGLYPDLGHWLSLADMSVGGCCVRTRFPAPLDLAQTGYQDHKAHLILPLQTPLPVSVEVRWQKRIKESRGDGVGVRQVLECRFGILFLNPSEEAMLGIRAFIKQLSLADAI